MVLETNTVAILICYLPCIIQCRILVDHYRGRFQYIHEKHSEKQTEQKRKKLQMVEEFHAPLLGAYELLEIYGKPVDRCAS